MKKLTLLIIALALLPTISSAEPPSIDINAKSAILTEQTSGQILFEKNPDEQLPIASVTKIMTLLLIMEALDEGQIQENDLVTVSERAMSMGGSTMFLETGEQVSVEEMLKGIAVASANDGAVAMAEFIAGSETEFVRRMNERAAALGMVNTSFMNTNGLDADGHYSSARDVAIMSRELLKHEKIFEYTTIWTDTMRGGKYQLANTNKLIRFYNGANGLKTGSTSKARCCLSATAKRDGMQLISVILGAPDSASRFDGARALLDYGFSAYSIAQVISADTELGRCAVGRGVSDDVGAFSKEPKCVLKAKVDGSELSYSIDFEDALTAPIYKGDKIGEAAIYKGAEEIDRIPVYAAEEVQKKTFIISYLEVLKHLC